MTVTRERYELQCTLYTFRDSLLLSAFTPSVLLAVRGFRHVADLLRAYINTDGNQSPYDYTLKYTTFSIFSILRSRIRNARGVFSKMSIVFKSPELTITTKTLALLVFSIQYYVVLKQTITDLLGV